MEKDPWGAVVHGGEPRPALSHQRESAIRQGHPGYRADRPKLPGHLEWKTVTIYKLESKSAGANALRVKPTKIQEIV